MLVVKVPAEAGADLSRFKSCQAFRLVVRLVPRHKNIRGQDTIGGYTALGGHIVDTTEFIKGRCYGSISFYESEPTRQRLWKIFRVAVRAKSIFVMDDEGDYLPIRLSTEGE